ncbi:hypothetical protein BY996DRAFT_6689643 [Phakopsora pachyrhizi]|nr:hypothetical protein BY996DRAFT_6689643 [Phakopsora pachyrhizi]
MSIHGTANFLSWHRYFVLTYEKALQEECNYTGYQPYWDWTKYSNDPYSSPIFDGSDASMSGNGEYSDITDGMGPLHANLRIPPGIGGGCVKSGPFKNMTVNLGPVLLYGFFSGHSGFGYNPRCLKRDISSWVSRRYTNTEKVISLIEDESNISGFQNTLQGRPEQGFLGVHGGGHYTVGGDPGADFFCSPGDPIFYLHHAMIDRVWWIWQNFKDLEERQSALAGTRTMYNIPPSPEATLDDLMDLGVNAPEITISEMMNTAELENWYIYL